MRGKLDLGTFVMWAAVTRLCPDPTPHSKPHQWARLRQSGREITNSWKKKWSKKQPLEHLPLFLTWNGCQTIKKKTNSNVSAGRVHAEQVKQERERILSSSLFLHLCCPPTVWERQIRLTLAHNKAPTWGQIHCPLLWHHVSRLINYRCKQRQM